ncbi:MAG: DM13 domain-containing protein [Polyangiaceae bacterium]|nr:DM13 domain-containing protein [Polyangiaceae bacterium]
MVKTRARWLGYRAGLLACGLAGGFGGGCQRPSSSNQDAESARLRLTGEFKGIAKRASGTAEIVQHADGFHLRLRSVRVDSQQMVRVYLVGAPQANTTRSVIETEMKYDMAALDQSTAEQIVELPSEPDPALRTVVLWEPAYKINLAYAPLRAVNE